MADSKLRVDPLTANIGAEVSGLDLREELSQEQVEQLEAALLEHLGVADCCVVGVSDPEWGETLRAVVQREPGSSLGAEELRVHCKALLAGYQVPREIDFVDRLPRTETGKLARRVIRDGYRGEASAPGRLLS